MYPLHSPITPSILGCFLLTAALTYAAPEQTASVLDTSGGQSTGGTLTLVSAAGQPGGISVSAQGDLVNYAGFLGTFSLQPTLDTDQDGLENELDADNDNDGLEDGVEIAGNEFTPTTGTDPNDADSDGDATRDGDEAAAGTNPLNDTQYLHITGMTGADTVSLTWQARHLKTYHIYRIDDLATGLPGTLVDTVTVLDPTALWPWYETEETYDHPGGGSPDHRGYYIQVQE